MMILDNFPALAPRQVLAVDDHPDTCEWVGLILQLAGYEVELAMNGLEAVEKVQRQRPKVVVMGIFMPRMDGYEAARRIRALPWGWHLRLIAHTGQGRPKECLAAGFDVHLYKPAAPNEILKQVAAGFSQERTVTVTDQGSTTIVLPPRREQVLRRLRRGR